MDKDVAFDMGWSGRLFIGQVFPMIKDEICGGRAIVMEGRPDAELARILDMNAGIDCWQIMDGGGLRGIACRVQKGEKVWGTFTVRKARATGAETEYAKRKKAIYSESGQIYPHFTIQAYSQTETGPIMAVAICRTKDLIDFIDPEKTQVKHTSNACFFVCEWAEMQRQGVDVRVIVSDFGQEEFSFLSPIRNYEKRLTYKKHAIPKMVFSDGKIESWAP
jgi:hypothetical protein